MTEEQVVQIALDHAEVKLLWLKTQPMEVIAELDRLHALNKALLAALECDRAYLSWAWADGKSNECCDVLTKHGWDGGGTLYEFVTSLHEKAMTMAKGPLSLKSREA